MCEPLIIRSWIHNEFVLNIIYSIWDDMYEQNRIEQNGTEQFHSTNSILCVEYFVSKLFLACLTLVSVSQCRTYQYRYLSLLLWHQILLILLLFKIENKFANKIRHFIIEVSIDTSMSQKTATFRWWQINCTFAYKLSSDKIRSILNSLFFYPLKSACKSITTPAFRIRYAFLI